MDGNGKRDFKRWGWVIGPIAEGNHSFDIYAGAGQCKLSAGTVVGSVEVLYTYDGIVKVTYMPREGYQFTETHSYIGSDILPKDGNKYTVAPGQFPQVHDTEPIDLMNTFSGLSGEIYVALHSVSCGEDDK